MAVKCPNEEKVLRIERIVYGSSGKNGLLEDTIRLDENVKALVETTEKLATTVSALVKFMSEMKVSEEERKSYRIKTQWLIALFVTVILGLLTTLIAIIIK